MPTYEDFTIRIGPRRGDGYVVTVVESPGGTGSGVLRLPFDLQDLGHLRETVGFHVRGDVERDMDTPQAWRPDGDDGIGCALFEGLFRGDVLSLFDQSVARASERSHILRLKLALNVEDPELAPLASLPWELTYRKTTREYLANSATSTVVRFLDVVQSNRTRPFVPPLRVLLVSANPEGDLDLHDETLRIRAALENKSGSEASGFEVDVLEGATYGSLEARLHECDYHVVHFMGHGTFDGERGGLLLDDGLVSGADLGALLRREPETRLVLLNACSSARVADGRGHDPFAGVAAALVMAGTPAVVAMQFPITDAAAIAFSERFYTSLAAGRPVEEAVSQGRMAVKGRLRDKLEWATPVLFLQAAAERLFVNERSREVKRPERDRAPVRSAEDVRLQPYMVDRARVMAELRLTIERDFMGQDAPLVCVVHGDSAQCQAALRDRLCSKELPRFLGLNARRESVTSYRLEWPKEYRDPSDFHDLLTWNLSDQTFGHSRGTPEAIRDDFFSRLPAVVVHSTIYSSEWAHFPPSLIRDYVAFWRRWPRSPAQRLIVFLIVKYQVNPNLNWFKRRREDKANETVERSLLALRPDDFDGVVFRVLPRLGDVALEDAERWADDHGHADLIPDIQAAYEACGPERPPMQMEALTSVLRQLLEKKYVQRAGTTW